ncbi:MAG: cytochrome c3 family protein [Planctomycetes bacterium]|nr:cytochrome c3 family protein [Planctomycetota bacterium]
MTFALRVAGFVGLWVLAGCSGETSQLQTKSSESCMLCHNGSLEDDYSGPGIENPHAFVGAGALLCTQCHGGNPNGTDELTSHVPPPPQIGDALNQTNDAKAYFNRLTLAGMDKFPNYSSGGKTYTALDYLQFVNPGDLRVVKLQRGCGECHVNHAEEVSTSLLATEAGIFSGAMYAIGADNQVPANDGLYENTSSDLGFRAANDASFVGANAALGAIETLIETPVASLFGVTAPDQIFNNPQFFAAALDDDRKANNQIITGSPLHKLFLEQISFTCGDCHLGSAGQNNRAGDFRSSGCSACHMQYSLGGKSGSADLNINKLEPANPDAIQAPERSHARLHRIASVKQTGTDGKAVNGIDDYACAGCHQGSNRTVMQYWGIRLDQNADVKNHRQYPANPATFTTTANDTRLLDPAAGNNTFNGRNGNQYLQKEDYDGDGRDDTPADVHYEAGLGCIDCHGGFDLHGGDTSTPGADIASRMEQQVGIRCENCHGTVDAYATTSSGTAWDGTSKQLAADAYGNDLDHVYKANDGTYWLRGRLDGQLHFIPQTRDTVVDSGRIHPTTLQPVYDQKASYAMGRIDADPSNGTGPKQTGWTPSGFAHGDSMDCVACHGSWTNTCMGCHLGGEYDTGNNFSNITGERIVYKQATADFTYQSPIYFQLGVGPRGKITQFSANTKVFYIWTDKNNQSSQSFTFTDRNGKGSDPNTGGFPSMSHNSMMAHSIRGKVAADKEGPRYCNACHLTNTALANYGTEYDTFRTAMATGDFGALDFNLLKQHFGQNTGNQLDSPLWAHMVAGLGTGLFLCDDQGEPVNPLDTFAGRKGANNIAPSTVWDPNRVRLNLDRVVDANGVAQGSNNHTWMGPGNGAAMRDGALDPTLAGPLGATLIRRLSDPTTGIVLDSWIDPNGAAHGGATGFFGTP